jgi:hypothetical protein
MHNIQTCIGEDRSNGFFPRTEVELVLMCMFDIESQMFYWPS